MADWEGLTGGMNKAGGSTWLDPAPGDLLGSDSLAPGLQPPLPRFPSAHPACSLIRGSAGDRFLAAGLHLGKRVDQRGGGGEANPGVNVCIFFKATQSQQQQRRRESGKQGAAASFSQTTAAVVAGVGKPRPVVIFAIIFCLITYGCNHPNSVGKH